MPAPGMRGAPGQAPPKLPTAPSKTPPNPFKGFPSNSFKGASPVKVAGLKGSKATPGKASVELGQQQQQLKASLPLNPRVSHELPRERNQKARVVPKAQIQRGSLGPSEFGGGEFNLGKAIENIPGSAQRLITGIPGAVAQTGKAAVELAKGHPKEALGIAKGIGDILLHPGKFAQEEPVSAAAMMGGPEAALSKGITKGAEIAAKSARGAESAARISGNENAQVKAAALANKLESVPSTKRAPLKLYGGIEKERQYSKLVTRKGLQKQAEGFREHVLGQDPNQATGFRLKRELKGGAVKPGQVDIQHGMGEAMTKYAIAHHEDFLRNLRKNELKGINPDHVATYYEGTARRPETAKADAKQRLEKLKVAEKELTGRQKRMNLAHQSRLEDFQKLPDEHLKHLEGVSRMVAEDHHPLVQEMVNLRHLEPNQVHAAYVPFALEHGHLLGRGELHYETNPGKHPAVAKLGVARKERGDAIREVARLSAEIKGAKYPAGFKSGKHYKLDEARERRTNARAEYNAQRRELVDAKKAGLMKNNGEMYPHIQDSAGKMVSTQEIKDLWDRETNHRPVGFISHRDQGLSSHSGRGGSRPGSVIRSRTGAHYQSGLYDNSWNAIVRQFRTANRNITGHLNENQLVSKFAIGGKHGFFHDKQEAEHFAENLTHSPEGKPYHDLGPMVVRSVGPDKILEHADMTHVPGMKILEQFGLPEHKMAEEFGPYGKWAVMPKSVSDRIDSHVAQLHPGSVARGYKKMTDWFRHSALYTTPRWPVGVNQENAIRLVAHKVSPLAMYKWTRDSPYLSGFSPKVGEAVTGELHRILSDPTVSTPEKVLARQHLGALGLGSMFGHVMNSQLKGVLEDMSPEERTWNQSLQAHAPVSHVLKGWEGYKAYIGHGLQKMETNAREAAVGKMVIDENKGFFSTWRNVIKNQDEMVHNYVHGITDPNKAVKFTEDLFDIMGNWNHLTPMARGAQKTWAPFGLWWLNSMKFVFKTLPKDHPMGTAVMAALVQGTGGGKGVGPWGEGVLPEFLQGSIGVDLPLLGKVNLNPMHYSPFDIAHEPTHTAASMLIPQASEMALRAMGKNPINWKDLAAKGETEDWAKNLLSMGTHTPEAVVPWLRPAIQLARKGGTQEQKSPLPWATKPGTERGWVSGLEKYLFPVPYTNSKKEASTKLPKLKREERKSREEKGAREEKAPREEKATREER